MVDVVIGVLDVVMLCKTDVVLVYEASVVLEELGKECDELVVILVPKDEGEGFVKECGEPMVEFVYIGTPVEPMAEELGINEVKCVDKGIVGLVVEIVGVKCVYKGTVGFVSVVLPIEVVFV